MNTAPIVAAIGSNKARHKITNSAKMALDKNGLWVYYMHRELSLMNKLTLILTIRPGAFV